MAECQKIKKCGLDHYGLEHFEVLQFHTTGLERVNKVYVMRYIFIYWRDFNDVKIFIISAWENVKTFSRSEVKLMSLSRGR